jgi:hypothetical protein
MFWTGSLLVIDLRYSSDWLHISISKDTLNKGLRIFYYLINSFYELEILL